MEYVSKVFNGYATGYGTAYSYSSSYPWNNTAKAFDWNCAVQPGDSGKDGSTDWWNTYATVKVGISTSTNRWYINGLKNWKSSITENFEESYDGTNGKEYTNFSFLPEDAKLQKINFICRSSMPTYAKELIYFFKDNTQIGTNVDTNAITIFSTKSTTSAGLAVSSTGWSWTNQGNDDFRSTSSSGAVFSIGSWTVSDLKNGKFLPKVELRRVSGASKLGYWYPRGFALQITVDIPLYELTTDSTNGSIENIGKYYSGKEVTLKAVPNPGYKFKGWTDGETNSTRVVTVKADATYTAIFEPSILVGDKAVKEIYVGNKKVKEVYIGDKKVWE